MNKNEDLENIAVPNKQDILMESLTRILSK